MDTTEQRAIFKQYLYRRYGDRSTPHHYLSDLDIFLRVLGNKSLQCVTAQDIDRFIDDQHRHGLAASTINRRLATLHTLFECLAAQAPDESWPNPVIWRRHRVKEGHLLPRDAADQDVERLFGVIDQARDAAMFGLMVGAGLRVAEVSQLRLGDLRVPSAPGQLAQLLVRGKGGKERMVWLTPFWYAKVAAWLAVRPTTSADSLFLNQHGRRISKDGIQYRLQGYCAAAGISITCHQLRHTFARRLADQRMPIESIAKLLGHAFVTTTQRYTLAANPDLRAAFQAAMAQIESCQTVPEPELPFVYESRPRQQPEPADAAKLAKALGRFASLPEWLAQRAVPLCPAALVWLEAAHGDALHQPACVAAVQHLELAAGALRVARLARPAPLPPGKLAGRTAQRRPQRDFMLHRTLRPARISEVRQRSWSAVGSQRLPHPSAKLRRPIAQALEYF